MSFSISIQHSFPAFTLDAAFDVPAPGVIALFGPSGCGKSTVIAAIAGLLKADAARVMLNGQDIAQLPAERRRIGLVFQDGRLFPHMSVAANLRYGLKRAPAGPTRFDDVVALLGIEHLLTRKPKTLSGGERQRVAIGRALLAQPQLLLMDEPLAALDAPRKAEILPYLAQLRDAFHLPIVYVTHALEEVARLADTLVLMEEGRVIAAEPLADITHRADLALAARDDAGAILDARIAAHDPDRMLSVLGIGGAHLLVPLLDRPLGAALRVRIPAREVILATEEPRGISIHNILHGKVRALAPDPAHRATLVEISVGRAVLLARITPDAVTRLALAPGAGVLALVKSVAVQVL